MNILSHLLASWTLTEASRLEPRDQAIVAWAGAAPDLDGLGLLADWGFRAAGLQDPGFYAQLHHSLLHGVFGAVLISAVAAWSACRRLVVVGWTLAAVHLHLLCDLVGSAGPREGDRWPVHYLRPFSEMGTLSWAGQWLLNSWQNLTIYLVLVCFAVFRTLTASRSPLLLFGSRANQGFVRTVQARWAQLAKVLDR